MTRASRKFASGVFFAWLLNGRRLRFRSRKKSGHGHAYRQPSEYCLSFVCVLPAHSLADLGQSVLQRHAGNAHHARVRAIQFQN